MRLISDASREQLHSLHPEAAAELARLESAIDSTGLDAGLLELTSGYFDTMLREQEWQPPAALSGRDQACLAFCEQYLVSVPHIDDEHVAALRAHLSPDDVYLYSNAVYLIEMSKRLDLTMEATLP